jgi:5'-3' exonuclease
MGIRYLNKYLIDKCSKTSIKQVHLSKLKNKTIVIDTSIYLYKFIGDGLLAENLYILITTLKKYNINALFVFDGTPPQEKWNTIETRNKEKDEAELMYQELTQQLSLSQYSEDERKKILLQMHTVKKQCIRIKRYQILFAKQMMEALDVKYIDAIGEADEICAKFCKSNIAFGCLSDDMDMFTYGCSNILRNLNLLKEEVTIYDYESIISELQLTPTIFTQLLIISTNDYNDDNDNNFNKSLKWFDHYKQSQHNDMSFKSWLVENGHLDNIHRINQIESIYRLDNNIDVIVNNLNDTYSHMSNKIKYNDLQELLRPYGFIFLNE